MDYRNISKTDLSLPIVGFGGAHLGELYAPLSDQGAYETLDTAWSNDIRYFDTAPWYGRGQSEYRIGNFLAEKAQENFILTTKVGRYLTNPTTPDDFDTSPWVGGFKKEINFDYSYDGIMRSYEQSIQRLQTHKIDALIIHDLDYVHHSELLQTHQQDLLKTGLKALEELKRTGAIKAYGMGINTQDAFRQALSSYELDFLLVAMPYTLLDQSSLDTSMSACLSTETSIIIGAPFCSGILASGIKNKPKYSYESAPPDVINKVMKIEKLCKDHNVNLQAAALQFPLAHKAVVSVIPGVTRKEEVIQNKKFLEEDIPAEFWTHLKEKGLIHPNAPT